jgi:hypothetical protein
VDISGYRYLFSDAEVLAHSICCPGGYLCAPTGVARGRVAAGNRWAENLTGR